MEKKCSYYKFFWVWVFIKTRICIDGQTTSIAIFLKFDRNAVKKTSNKSYQKHHLLYFEDYSRSSIILVVTLLRSFLFILRMHACTKWVTSRDTTTCCFFHLSSFELFFPYKTRKKLHPYIMLLYNKKKINHKKNRDEYLCV